jgi:hypothetical protein
MFYSVPLERDQGSSYCFLERSGLSVRAITHVGQKSSSFSESVSRVQVQAMNVRFQPGGTYSCIPKR